jgi:hypothetical protein
LAALPSDAPVWVVDCPGNRPAVHRLRGARPAQDHLTGITTFNAPLDCSGEDLAIGILAAIDLHHGEYSADPPYSEIEVIGCAPTTKLAEAVEEFGFTRTSVTLTGFLATRR